MKAPIWYQRLRLWLRYRWPWLRQQWADRRRRFFYALGWPLRLVGQLFNGLWWLLTAWVQHRRWSHLLWGLPTVAVLGLAGLLFGVRHLKSDYALPQLYRQAAKDALERKNFAAAKLYFERFLELQPSAEDVETLADLAEAANELKDYPRLNTLIEKLAPIDRPVHLKSHLSQALRLLEPRTISKDDLRAAITHLQHVLTLQPNHLDGNTYLGEIYFQRGAWDKSIQHLRLVLEAKPSYHMMLAKAYIQIGEKTLARKHGQLGREFFAKMLESRPDDKNLLLNFADSSLFSEDYQQAVSTLQKGMRLHPEEKIFPAGLARCYTAWASSLNETPGPLTRKRQFELLSAAMLHNPDDNVWFDGLMRLLVVETELANDVKQFLLSNIAEGKAVGASHLMLGSNAFVQSNRQQCEFHLSRAFELLPQAPIVANNLAWFLIHQEQPDPERAMKLIEPVATRFPENPRFRDTRGHVHVRLEEWLDGIRDLEFALVSMPANADTHRALATAYDKIGNDDLSKQHRRIIDQLKKSSSQ